VKYVYVGYHVCQVSVGSAVDWKVKHCLFIPLEICVHNTQQASRATIITEVHVLCSNYSSM
jgi:hypothetical protein